MCHYMYCDCIQACQLNTLLTGASNPVLSHEIARNLGTVTMASDDNFTTSKFVNLLAPSDLPPVNCKFYYCQVETPSGSPAVKQ